MKKKVAIIIVNWNNKEYLKGCLNSIRQKTSFSHKIIVVDNGSLDGSIEMVKKTFGKKIDLLKNKKNEGFSKANNQGIKYAIKKYNPDYFLLLNNDTLMIQKGWLKKMVGTFKEDSVGIVGCKMVYEDGSIQESAGYLKIVGEEDASINKQITCVDGVKGACFLFKKELIRKIGFLDEEFSPAYFEETDFCIRAKFAGFQVVFNPNVKIIHYDGKSTKKMNKKYLFFIIQKNKIRFILLNYPLSWIFLRFLWEVSAMFKYILNGKGGLYFKAWVVNLKNIKEILKKRKERWRDKNCKAVFMGDFR